MSALSDKARAPSGPRTRLPSPTKTPQPLKPGPRPRSGAFDDANFKIPALPVKRTPSVRSKVNEASNVPATALRPSRNSTRTDSNSGPFIPADGPMRRSSSASRTAAATERVTRRTSAAGPPSSYKAPAANVGAPEQSATTPSTPRQPQQRPQRTPSLSRQSRSTTTTSRPSSASSQRAQSQTSRPAFNTTSTPSRHATSSSVVPVTSKSSRTGASTRHIALQMQMLHSYILAQAAPTTLEAFTKSAYSKLSMRYSALQATYDDLRALERQTRQYVNILALHEWSNGNRATLVRKFGILVSILGELMVLIAGPTKTGKAVGEDTEAGPYTQVVSQFSTWIAWVQHVWTTRNSYSARESGAFYENDNKRIEGLGDSVKASLRVLADNVNHLSVRLEQVRDKEVKDIIVGEEAGSSEASVDLQKKHFESTPAALVTYAHSLLEGMKEELQLMREVEFEVVVGEQAYEADRLRSIEGEVGGGFGTPVRT